MPEVRLEARLMSDSVLLSGKPIDFYYRVSGTTAWILISTQQTVNGVAITTVTLDPGKYDFKASFPGDDDYESSEATVTGYTVGAMVERKTEVPWWLIVVAVFAILLLIIGREEGE